MYHQNTFKIFSPQYVGMLAVAPDCCDQETSSPLGEVFFLGMWNTVERRPLWLSIKSGGEAAVDCSIMGFVQLELALHCQHEFSDVRYPLLLL
jgi:hypothetical protein